ncbi:hypothetical protein TruAng_009486 [Truncatella angustata]|nr:hypothetical protein TruAng_009486 [Truncatella angustata]
MDRTHAPRPGELGEYRISGNFKSSIAAIVPIPERLRYVAKAARHAGPEDKTIRTVFEAPDETMKLAQLPDDDQMSMCHNQIKSAIRTHWYCTVPWSQDDSRLAFCGIDLMVFEYVAYAHVASVPCNTKGRIILSRFSYTWQSLIGTSKKMSRRPQMASSPLCVDP